MSGKRVKRIRNLIKYIKEDNEYESTEVGEQKVLVLDSVKNEVREEARPVSSITVNNPKKSLYDFIKKTGSVLTPEELEGSEIEVELPQLQKITKSFSKNKYRKREERRKLRRTKEKK